MLYETLSQGAEFAAMTAAGAGMGFVSLIFCGLRRVTCAGKWGCLLCDSVMGIVWGAVGCAALYAACRGEARAFHFMAMISGGAMFMAGVSPAARNFCGRMGGMFVKIWRKAAQNRVLRAVFR